MDNIFSSMFGIFANLFNKPDRIARDTVGEYTISTMFTIDQGYETAIWKGNGEIVIVARYETKEEAETGHAVWQSVCELNPKRLWSVQFEEFINL